MEGIEEEKEDELDESAAKNFKRDHEDEDAFFDELDQDVIDEGVTTNNMSTFDKIK